MIHTKSCFQKTCDFSDFFNDLFNITKKTNFGNQLDYGLVFSCYPVTTIYIPTRPTKKTLQTDDVDETE